MALIELRGVSKTFGGIVPRHVLDGVHLSVERGEFVSIVGAMGSGKSTLLNIAAGLQLPDDGEVLIDGERLHGVRKDAAIVFQNYSLLPWFSALENVRLAIGAAAPQWPRPYQRDQARRYLETVGLGNAIHRRPGQLSGGMRQRVAIARAFAIRPEILFLDEPFGALDALTRGSLQQELARMCASTERQLTTVMITNNVDEAIMLSDRIIPMTRAPRSRLGDAVAVPLAKPRTVTQLLHDEEVGRVRAAVVERLTEGVQRPLRVRQRAAAHAAAVGLVSVESE